MNIQIIVLIQFFSNSIYLRENKRLKTEEDKQKLKQLNLDIFDKKLM